MQAVMASDFALPQFRFLQRLLLVHGHWCYDRLARMVLYFFKNEMFVFTVFWYQFFNGFTAQVIIDPVYLILHNLLFTSVPPLLFGSRRIVWNVISATFTVFSEIKFTVPCVTC